METPVTPQEVLVVVGLEETPDLVPEPGSARKRPPALALLNNLRETLRKSMGETLNDLLGICDLKTSARQPGPS